MNEFAQALKSWRKTRRFSQLALAVEAEVSTRHISFLETGRSSPSPEMILRLGDALQLPLAARNQMLTLAGFATRYPAREWSAEAMAPIRRALEHTLVGHAPYPALAVDRLWSVVRMNEPARALFAPLSVGEGDSLIELMLSEAAPALIENWPEVAHHAALRLRTESVALGGVAELERAADTLGRVPGYEPCDAGPVVPTIFRLGDGRLSLFSTIAQFGTPEDLTLADLRLELYFPSDRATEVALRAMASPGERTADG